MKASIVNISVAAMMVFISAAAYAQSKGSDPTPRTFITPDSASKVRVYEAKQRRSIGVLEQNAVQSTSQVSSSGFAKSCNTTIGPAAGSQANSSGNSGRYGAGNANKDSTVIVTGDVINVCK
jgi:hypothetical protein